MNLIFSIARIAVSRGRTAPHVTVREPGINRLTRTFVETGDERCPLAGIWSRLTESDATSDDPESAWPAMRRLPLPWRAFSHFRASHARMLPCLSV